jgi:hypothetical protein
MDALSTFTASELLPYNDFVALTVVAGALSLSRVDLKKKVRLFDSDTIFRVLFLIGEGLGLGRSLARRK